MGYQAKLRVWRGDGDGGGLQDFSVEVNEGEVVLDIIHRLQQTQTGDLAVRWNCKAGKCGSCSAEINGRPTLMCMCRLNTLDLNEPVTVEPMRTFPLIKDLVTDVSWNFRKKKTIQKFSPTRRHRSRIFTYTARSRSLREISHTTSTPTSVLAGTTYSLRTRRFQAVVTAGPSGARR